MINDKIEIYDTAINFLCKVNNISRKDAINLIEENEEIIICKEPNDFIIKMIVPYKDGQDPYIALFLNVDNDNIISDTIIDKKNFNGWFENILKEDLYFYKKTEKFYQRLNYLCSIL